MNPLSFSTLGCPDWTLEQAAANAAQHGYRALEIRLLDGQIIPAEMSPGERKRIRTVMQEHDLDIVALGASTRFSSPDPDERAANVAELGRYLELANDLGAGMVRTFGGSVAQGHSLEETAAWLAEGLNQAAVTAEQQGVTIGLETHDSFSRGADVALALAQVESPFVTVIWDVHHPFRQGETLHETFAHIGARTAHVHLKDARRKSDGGWQLVLMGEGEVPCYGFLELLKRHHYEGYIGVEWEKKWHPEIEPPEVALPQHAEVLRRWLGELSAEHG